MKRMATHLELRPASYGRDSCAITGVWSERRSSGSPQASAILKPSPHTRPRPGRRRFLPPAISNLQLLLVSIVLLSNFCVPASATRSHDGRRKQRYGELAEPLPRFEYVEPNFELFKPGDIVYDRRFPVVPIHNDFHKRQHALNVDDSSKGGAAKTTAQKQLKFSSTSTARPAAATTAAAFTTAVLPESSKSTSASSTEPTSLVTAPGTGSNSLPRPFDTGLGNNYTNPNCPVFINGFLRNDTFTSCLPLSLLLQVSFPLDTKKTLANT